MIEFYALAAILCIVAVALLTRAAWWPVTRGASAPKPAEGTPPVEADMKAPSTPGAARPSTALTASLAAFMCVVAIGGYRLLGAPAATVLGPGSGAEAQADSAQAPTPEKLAAMIDQLAARLKSTPDDAEGWTMLARSYVMVGDHAKAVGAFKEAVRLRGDDPELLTDYADALAMSNQRSLAGEPSALVARALKIDPRNVKALALAGAAAFERRDYRGAVGYWETLVANEPPDGPFTQQLQAGIAEARQRAGMPAASGSAPAAAPLASAQAGASAAAQAGASAAANARVGGTVTLSSSVASRVALDDTVFVFARAVNGPRMPLAILRKHVRDLPLRFTLDDSMAMSPENRLSLAQRVVVGARVSKSGNAMPRAGDLEGMSQAVELGTNDLKVEINTEVTK